MNFWPNSAPRELKPQRAWQNSVGSERDNGFRQGSQKQDEANAKKHDVHV
jgi:hypothetical protein